MKIAVIDYGMGNILSVVKALERFADCVLVVNGAFDPKDFDKFVLPGVGAFGDAVEGLKNKGLWDSVEGVFKLGKPYLGICLGMQLLSKASDESAGVYGFGVFNVVVKKFSPTVDKKVPQMGWNKVFLEKRDPLFEGISDGSFFYFCHSFYVPENVSEDYILAKTDYITSYVSALRKDKIWAVQFHPEKSQKLGLKVIENFVNRCF